MPHGFPNCYSAEDLDAFATEVRELAERFANALVPMTDAEGNPVDGASTD